MKGRLEQFFGESPIFGPIDEETPQTESLHFGPVVEKSIFRNFFGKCLYEFDDL